MMTTWARDVASTTVPSLDCRHAHSDQLRDSLTEGTEVKATTDMSRKAAIPVKQAASPFHVIQASRGTATTTPPGCDVTFTCCGSVTVVWWNQDW